MIRVSHFSPHILDEIRRLIPISQVVGRRVVWDKKKTNPRRGDWWACCPLHGEKSPSFHCEDRKGRYYCFGCGASGDHFTFMVEIEGLHFREAVVELAREAGVVLPRQDESTPEEDADRQRRAAERQVEHELRREQDLREQLDDATAVRKVAYRIWKSARPLAGTLGETYLRSRGIDFELGFPSLRFAPTLPFSLKGVPREAWPLHPALIAAVVGPDLKFKAIWRIYLDDDGSKLRVVERGYGDSAKLGLAPTEGGGVLFRARGRTSSDPLGSADAGEGLESSLGVYGIRQGKRDVWATLSTSGMRNFIPPPSQTFTHIWPDGDTDRMRTVNRRGCDVPRLYRSPGVTAANDLHARLESEGRPSLVQDTEQVGRDYLDIYVQGGDDDARI